MNGHQSKTTDVPQARWIASSQENNPSYLKFTMIIFLMTLLILTKIQMYSLANLMKYFLKENKLSKVLDG